MHCASLLRTIFASLARAHERVHVQNLRDFPQTKLDFEINAPFLLNEHGDPRTCFHVFAKTSLIKNIFEEEKKFDSGTRFFFRKIVPHWVYFGQGEDFKLTTELSEKVQYSRNQAISENSSPLGVFWPRRGLQANHRTVRKSAIFPQPSNQKQLK